MAKKTSIEIENKIEQLSGGEYTKTDIAKMLNVTHKVVNRVGKERNLTFKVAPNARASKELEDKVLSLYKKGHNTKYISSSLNITQLHVNRILKRNGVKSIPKNQLNVTIDDEKEICRLYKIGFSTVDIANIYNHVIKCDKTVSKILKKNNVDLRCSGSKAIIYNESYFSNIDNEMKAYLLGFIYADGNVRIDNNNNHIFQIELQHDDKYILETIREQLQCYVKVKDFNSLTVSEKLKPINKIIKDKNGRKSYTCSLQIISEKIYNDLNKLGVTPNKTFNLTFPNTLKEDLIRHFIRGYFDGDGSITLNNNRPRYIFYGQHNFLNSIKNILQSNLNTNDVKIFDKKNVSMLSYASKKDTDAIYNYLYHNSNIYLTRKKIKYNSMVIPR